MSKMVTQTNLDTVRIEVLGEGRAVQIPAEFVLAVDLVLRLCHEQRSHLGLLPLSGEPAWGATIGAGTVGYGATPWGAIVALEKELRTEAGE